MVELSQDRDRLQELIESAHEQIQINEQLLAQSRYQFTHIDGYTSPIYPNDSKIRQYLDNLAYCRDSLERYTAMLRALDEKKYLALCMAFHPQLGRGSTVPHEFAEILQSPEFKASMSHRR